MKRLLCLVGLHDWAYGADRGKKMRSCLRCDKKQWYVYIDNCFFDYYPFRWRNRWEDGE